MVFYQEFLFGFLPGNDLMEDCPILGMGILPSVESLLLVFREIALHIQGDELDYFLYFDFHRLMFCYKTTWGVKRTMSKNKKMMLYEKNDGQEFAQFIF